MFSFLPRRAAFIPSFEIPHRNSVGKRHGKPHNRKHCHTEGEKAFRSRGKICGKGKKRGGGVHNAAAEVIKAVRNFFVPLRRHHKALTGGADHIIKLYFEAALFFYEHKMTYSEGNKFISGNKAENKVPAFVNYCLHKRGYVHNYHSFRKHKQKRRRPLYKGAEEIHGEDYKNAADRPGKEHYYFCRDVAVIFLFLQVVATFFVLITLYSKTCGKIKPKY